MKKKLLLILAGVVLFLFIAGTSFFWYQVFYQSKEEDKEQGIANIQIQLDNNENTIHEEDAVPTDNVDQIEGYSFSVKNVGTSSGIYKVLLEDSITNSIGTTLSRSQLSYELFLNGLSIRSGTLDEISNNVLDERSIDGQKENQYVLKIWLSEDSMESDWKDKSYSYQINIQMEEEI